MNALEREELVDRCCEMVRKAKKLRKLVGTETTEVKKILVYELVKFMRAEIKLDIGGIRERAPYSEDSIKKILEADDGIGRYQQGNTTALAEYFLTGKFLVDHWPWAGSSFSQYEKETIMETKE